MALFGRSIISKLIVKTLGLVVILVALVNCTDSNEAKFETADSEAVLYIAEHIWTGDKNQPWASAMVVENGVFKAVGKSNELLTQFSGAQLKYLDSGLVVPGFADNHTHFMDGAAELLAVDTYNAKTKEAFVAVIAEYAKAMEPGKWMIGGIWDHETWGGELPSKDWIDEYTADNPVFLLRLDGHMAIANSRALELAGMSAKAADIKGGTIVRDAKGDLTGLLKDNAMNQVFAVIPPLTRAEQDEIFNAGVQEALRNGVTQIHDMGRWEDLALFKRAKSEGRLPIRTFFYAPIAKRQELAAMIEEEGAGDDHLSWDGVKELTDGSLGSGTAWFYEPYADDPSTSGFPLMPFEDYEESIAEAHNLGLKLAIHAIGDQANDRLLDILEKLGPFETAPRIEHAQHLSQEALGRFAEIGVVASMQPYHAIDDGRWAINRLGEKRLQGTYAFKSLIDTGATLTFGSDWSVAPLDPIAGIFAAVTRQTLDGNNPEGWIPDEKISVVQALEAYTLNNAMAVGREERLGSIAKGKLADFVVLDENILELQGDDIGKVEVLQTYVAGQLSGSSSMN